AAADELDEVVGEIPAPAAEAPAAARPAQFEPVDLSFANYKTEVMLVVLAVGLVANYFYGSRTNAALSRAWEKPVAEVLRENFSVVGDGARVLEWDSAADMLFYASGRRHCKFAQGHLMLKARQDALALLNDLAANNQEKLEIEVALNDDEANGFVFAVVPRKRSKAISRDRYDIATFAKAAGGDAVSPKLVILSESADVTSQLLDSGLGDLLADPDALLEELVISDSPAEKPESHDFKREKKLAAVIRLPPVSDANVQRFRETLAFVFYLVDFVCDGMALRPETVRKLSKAREDAFKEFARMAEQEKQDALAKTLAEKRRIELEEVSKMSPEQRRKWEEKDRKRQLKKEQGKRIRRVRKALNRAILTGAMAGRRGRKPAGNAYANGDEPADSRGVSVTESDGCGGEGRKISAQEEADLSSALIAKLLAEDCGGGSGGGGGYYGSYYDDYGNGAGAFGGGYDDAVSGSEADDDWDPSRKRQRAPRPGRGRKAAAAAASGSGSGSGAAHSSGSGSD
ncbi:hypothetical protein LPJ56_004759, partial [Coemansia sp. RSA 2599]